MEAVSLYSRGHYAKAAKILETLSIATPEDDAVWYYLALCQRRSADSTAVESIRKAVHLDSGNYWYRNFQATLLDGEEKLLAYEKMKRDFPRAEDVDYQLLPLYTAAGRMDRALECVERIEQTSGVTEETVRTKFYIYIRDGKDSLAIHYLDSLNAEFSSPDLLTTAGDWYASEYMDSTARERYQEALDLDSEYVPALIGLADVCRRSRDMDGYFRHTQTFMSSSAPAGYKALYLDNVVRALDQSVLRNHAQRFNALAETALSKSPGDSTLLLNAGKLYYNTGNLDGAGGCFLVAHTLYPDSRRSSITYLQYLVSVNDLEDVISVADECYSRTGEVDYLDYANYAANRLEKYDLIIENNRKVIKAQSASNETVSTAYASIGDAYHSMGNAKEAYKAYEKALKANPDNIYVLNNYAYFLALDGKKLKKAYAMSKKTVEASPDEATYLDTFGWILHLMGKDLEAKPFFKHAMLYGGKDSAVILDHYADVLEALGEKDLAASYRNQAKAKKK